MELIRVGISACLTGQVFDALRERFELVPVGPEVEMGLEELSKEDLSGFVFKGRSPSRGLHVGEHDDQSIFAAALTERFPQLPLAEEVALTEPNGLRQFVERVEAYSRRAPRKPMDLWRVTRDGVCEARDVVAVEEPLEIRLHDRAFAVIMRTPGADRELSAGFLLAEGVIKSEDDLGAVDHCVHPDQRHAHNVVNVFLTGTAAASLPALLDARRNVLANSSCGICGRVTIESLRQQASPLPATQTFTREAIHAMPGRLRERQPLFEDTGALHAAAIFPADGDCLAAAEDVGRHNAVDKVVGQLLLSRRLPLRGYALAVSGRTSYEIVQKAWLAGLEVVCAVSAPSSLAIELAQEAGITLIGFARGDSFNIYSHANRVVVGRAS